MLLIGAIGSSEVLAMSENGKFLIIFDGWCKFCSRGVNFLIKRDKKRVFLFATNQSDSGIQAMQKFQQVGATSVLFVKDNHCYSKSGAVIRILMVLPHFWKLTAVFLILPSFFRDFFYDFIAARRYSLWGKREVCRRPSDEEMERFLK